MTPTRDLATCFARAVIDRIETDRCCNSDNIGDAIFREMAVTAAGPGQPQHEGGTTRLTAAAREMLQEIEIHVQPGANPSCFDHAVSELRAALRQANVL